MSSETPFPGCLCVCGFDLCLTLSSTRKMKNFTGNWDEGTLKDSSLYYRRCSPYRPRRRRVPDGKSTVSRWGPLPKVVGSGSYDSSSLSGEPQRRHGLGLISVGKRDVEGWSKSTTSKFRFKDPDLKF